MKKGLLALGLAGIMMLGLSSCSLDNINTIPGGDILTIIPEHVHEYVDKGVVVEPSCTAGGYSEKSCECGNTLQYNKTNAKGHTKGDFVIENEKKATCTEAGSHDEVYYCTVCGVEISRLKVNDDALGHDYDYNDGYIAPTCTTAGTSNGGKCKRCGDVISKGDIPATGHKYVAKMTKTLNTKHTQQIYSCTVCHGEFVGGVIVSYEDTYEYKQYSTNEKYAAHRAGYQAMYKKLYDACNKVLNSTDDYQYKIYKGAGGTEMKAIQIASFNYSEYEMTAQEAGSVLFSFVSANPQFYFLSNQYITTSNTIDLIMDDSCMTNAVRKEIQAKMIKTSVAFHESIKDKTLTDVELAKAIHDFIIAEIDYQYDDGVPSSAHSAHSIIGFVDGLSSTGGVCECYAKSYLYLSYMFGLNTINVSGKGGDADGNGNVGGHAWNYTCIDGKWYGVDVTWDDQKETIYNYFLCSKAKMEEKHYPGVANFTYNPSTEYFQVPLPELAEAGIEL